VISIWVAVADTSQLAALRGDVLAAVAYVSNWWLAFQHVSYFTRFGPPSPLGNLWSLAVEEQFYLLWPWLLWLGLIWIGHRRHKRGARVPAGERAALAGQPAHAGPEQVGGPEVTCPVPSQAAELRALGYLLAGRATSGTVPPPKQPFWQAMARRLGVGNTRRDLWPLALVTLLLAAASALEMALLYHPSFDPTRVYDGTDTRAFGLLIGAALAMAWPSKALSPKLGPGAQHLLDLLGLVGLVVIAVLVWRTNEYSSFLYRGGMLVLSLAALLVVAAVAHPASRLGRLLGCRPLRWVGVRSYAIYLWHYPIIVLTTPTAAAGTDVPRAVLQVGATLALADLSWRLIEAPVRSGALGRLATRLRSHPWRARPPSPARWAAIGILPATLLLAGLGLAGALPAAAPGTLSAAGVPPGKRPTAPTGLSGTTAGTAPPTSVGRPKQGTSTTRPAPAAASATAAASTTAASSSRTTSPTTALDDQQRTGGGPPSRGDAPPPSGTASRLQTSCKEVVHIGDSTSESLVSSNYLPDLSQQLGAQYARVGVERSIMRIEGGDSIVEVLPGEQNGYEIAQGLVRHGYHGCWVIALGTNDTADVYVGSNVGLATRIKRMMSVIGDDPVMWVNVKTLLATGPYSETNMRRWDEALLNACPEYPNMRVFNWAGMAKEAWYTSDGIHYNSPGSAPRAAAIADALATAFPATHAPAAHAPATDRPATSGASRATRGRAHTKPLPPSCVVNGSPTWDLPTFQY